MLDSMPDENELQTLLRTLSDGQLRFVAARMNASTDREAAAKVGLGVDSIYNWPNKADVNRCVQLARLDGVNIAREKLRRLAADAVDALGEALKEGKKIDAAIAILDRIGLEAGQKLTVGTTDRTMALLEGLRKIREAKPGPDEDAGDDANAV
jgi:hypothetical protein